MLDVQGHIGRGQQRREVLVGRPRGCVEGEAHLLHHELRAGERVGLRAAAGRDPRALLERLAGLGSPQDGYVTLDGADLRDLTAESVRAHIALVREPQILPGPLLDNLRLARSDVSLEEVQETLDRLGLLDDIRALPEGLKTPLGPDGGPLSASQAAQLELARAMIAKPALLLLDEAETAIDDETLPRVLDGLFAADAPWTLLIASRDERVLSRCDRVLRFEGDGHLVAAPRPVPTAPGASR